MRQQQPTTSLLREETPPTERRLEEEEKEEEEEPTLSSVSISKPGCPTKCTADHSQHQNYIYAVCRWSSSGVFVDDGSV